VPRELPRTLQAALDGDWLSEALAPAGLPRVTKVDLVDPVQVNQQVKATIVRIKAHFADGEAADLCLKAFLDRPDGRVGSPQAARESEFYNKLASKISVRTPECVVAPIDPETQHTVLIMRDLVVDGVRFCTALEPFDAERAAQSLEQLARLHTSHTTLGPIAAITWTSRQIDYLLRYMTPETVQKLLDDPRSEGLPSSTADAHRLFESLKALSAIDAQNPAVLIHGDCHAGNVFLTEDGVGLIDWQLLQQGGWALDVAYHMAAVLPVELAEREERTLLKHYLDTVGRLGGSAPDEETAWRLYRMSVVYGFFLWAITRTVAPEIIKTFINRLGSSITRHDSYRLLGV
jgi:hypothetical protein